MHVIQSANTTVGYEGWIQINFTTTLSDWLMKKSTNNILYITIEYENENGVMEPSYVSVNYLLSYSDNEHQPFITAYFENENGEGHSLKHGNIRNVSSTTTVRKNSIFCHLFIVFEIIFFYIKDVNIFFIFYFFSIVVQNAVPARNVLNYKIVCIHNQNCPLIR